MDGGILQAHVNLKMIDGKGEGLRGGDGCFFVFFALTFLPPPDESFSGLLIVCCSCDCGEEHVPEAQGKDFQPL
jgi:hypothetical protein